MTANNQSQLHQLTSDTSNTSVPSKPSTSLCSTRLSHQVSNNPLHGHTDSIQSTFNEDHISKNDNSSFATPIEAIYIPDIKIEPDLDECEISLENLSKNHDADMQPPTQIDNPASSSVPGAERLQHPQVPRQLTSHTSNTLLEGNPSCPDHSTIQFPMSSSPFLSDMNLHQHLVKKYHIKDLSTRVPGLSDQMLDSVQQSGTVDCNVVGNQISERRNVRINLEPETVDLCVCDDQVPDNLQQNLPNTVNNDDIEVPFEAIFVPVVQCEPDLVTSEPSSHLSTAQFAAVTVRQKEMENAEADSDVQPYLPGLEISRETSSPGSSKDHNTNPSVFRCAHCSFTSNFKSKITSHIVKQHANISNAHCQECGKSFKNRSSLYNHVSRAHPNKRSYKCPLCKRGFQLKEYYDAHIKDHNTIFQCDVCAKILSTKYKLTEHKMRMHNKNSPLSCHMCSTICYTEASLKRHLGQVHSNVSYKCDICDKSFKSKTHLRAHERIVHASVRAFSCNQCEKTFVSKDTLKRHLLIHSDLRPFKCKKCILSFKRNEHLTKHIRRVHANVRAFKCHLCGKSYKSKCYLTRHLIRHNDVRISLQDPFNNHDADKLPFTQIDNPSNTASSSLPGTERLQHPQEPRHLTSHTSNTSMDSKSSFCVRPTTQIPTSSSSSLSDMDLLQHLVTEYHIKDLTVRLPRLSDQVLDCLQQNGTVDCNVVDNQMSEQRNVRIKLEPVTVDPCGCDDQVSDNLQQNLSSTVDDDTEVPFEAIFVPVVKCEPDLVISEPNSDLSADQSANEHFATFTVKQEEMENAEADSDALQALTQLNTSADPSSNKDVTLTAPVYSFTHYNSTTNCNVTSHDVNRHLALARYKCQECRMSFKHRDTLAGHMSRVHPDKWPYKCPLCKRGFKLEKYFNAHIKNHDKMSQCDVCGKILRSKGSLAEHKMIIHTQSSPLSCDRCGKIFYTDRSLKLHTRTVHSNVSFKCDICDRSFNLKRIFHIHQQRVHAPVSAFACDQCEKTFVTKYMLKQHLLAHANLLPFQCEKCGSCCKDKAQYYRHMRTVHRKVGAFKCHLCGKSFEYKRYLTRHLINHSDVRHYTCDKCGKQFNFKAKLKRHISSHSEIGPFACAQCDSKFKSKAKLAGHLRRAHSDLRPFSSDKYSLACKTQSDSHERQLVHSNVQTFIARNATTSIASSLYLPSLAPLRLKTYSNRRKSVMQ